MGKDFTLAPGLLLADFGDWTQKNGPHLGAVYCILNF